MRRLFSLWILLWTLSACNSFLGEEKEERLPGERVTIMAFENTLEAEVSEEAVQLGPLRNPKAWPQDGLIPIHAVGRLAVGGVSYTQSATIGDGEAWETILVPSPVIGDGKVFVIDAEGVVSAHKANDIDTVEWVSEAAVAPEDHIGLGGGLGYANGRVFVTTGYGDIVALDAATGTQKWKVNVRVPFRTPPTLIGRYLIALGVNNELFALNMATGETEWRHEGITETSGYLRIVTPAADKDYVIAPYSNGEIVALQLSNGRPVWADTISMPKRTQANATFGSVGGNPMIAGDAVYSVSSGGLLVANRLVDGGPLWEREISSLHDMWLAGDSLFVIAVGGEVLCLNRFSGAVRWKVHLPKLEEGQRYFDPLAVNEEIWVASNHGELQRISAKDGVFLESLEIPDDVATTPIIASKNLYVVTKDAMLHRLYE